MKVNHKWLKVVLALEVKKLSLFYLVLKFGKFHLFDNFFLDLANFWDLDNFLVFNNFLHFSINSSLFSMLLTSLVASILLVISTCNETVVFSIDVSGAVILLKL